MSLKNGYKMSQERKFEIVDSEVRSFYEYCREAGMSEEELEIICRPLSNAVRRASIKRWTRVCMFFVMVFAIGFTVCQTDTFQWHASATARIILIKLLPAWDWTPLYYNKCLIERSQGSDAETSMSTTDCISCEAIRDVTRISSTNYNEVFHHHLLRSAPVIVTDANQNWHQVDFNLTTLITEDDRLQNSVPCRILTNMRIPRQPMDLGEIAGRITNNNIPNWFVHFQNCDIKAVKAFRVLAPKPYFLSPHLPPSHFNWLLISNNYDTHRFKQLELDIGLIILSQLKGTTIVQLRPRAPCEDDCYIINFDVNEGETLVLANSMWEFEYLPEKDGVNVAMVTETDWVES